MREYIDPAEAFDADDIGSFCRRHRISQSFYFKLRNQGLGPREMQIGNRVLISREAGRAWRLAREAETASKSEAAAQAIIG